MGLDLLVHLPLPLEFLMDSHSAMTDSQSWPLPSISTSDQSRRARHFLLPELHAPNMVNKDRFSTGALNAHTASQCGSCWSCCGCRGSVGSVAGSTTADNDASQATLAARVSAPAAADPDSVPSDSPVSLGAELSSAKPLASVASPASLAPQASGRFVEGVRDRDRDRQGDPRQALHSPQ